MMKYRVYVEDTELKEKREYVLEARRNVALKTVVLNGVKAYVDEMNYPDPTDFLREVKSLHREAEDELDFAEQLRLDLDVHVGLHDADGNDLMAEDKVWSL